MTFGNRNRTLIIPGPGTTFKNQVLFGILEGVRKFQILSQSYSFHCKYPKMVHTMGP